MRKYAIVVAGGKGLRMGGEIPKQFIPVQGRPVLMRTLDAFHAYDESVELIVVLPVAQQGYWNELCREYDFRIPHRLADGGETRFHSVANGLAEVPDGETDALVAVHDGVRPFVSREVIAACYESAFRERAAIPVAEVVETLRCLKSNETEGDSVTVDRAQYRLVQTPQTFRADVLKAAYRQEYRPFFTDDASVVEAMGIPVSLVPGNRENIKITNGKGWSYGIDLSFTKEVGSFTGTIGYGLMWNWRKFSQLNHGVKFPAKFDNRHKININAAYKLNEKVEFNAGWTYMTGNRLTLSMYNYDIPGSQFPDAPTVGPPGYGNEIDGIDYYSSRNNVRMPAYHRLDIAININKKLKKGRKAIWNVSLYNAYCHMNAITIQKDNENNVFFTSNKDKWHRAFKTLSFIPTIPSVSYTYIF